MRTRHLTRTTRRFYRACLGIVFSTILVLCGTARAEELRCGDVISDSLMPDGVRDFTLQANAGDVVSIFLVKSGGISSFTPIFDLFKPSGSTDRPVVSSARGANIVVLPDTGEYTITVQAVGTTENQYFLGVEWLMPLKDVCSEAPFAINSAYSGRLGDARQDVLTLEVAEPTTVDVSFSAEGVDFAPLLRWFSADGTAAPLHTVEPGTAAVELDGPASYVLLLQQNLPPDRNDAFNNVGGTYHLEVSDATGVRFRRGDPNQDSSIDLTDAIVILERLFLGPSEAWDCEKSGDVDDSDALEITDAIALLNYLFLGSQAPATPHDNCGFGGATTGTLTCERFSSCL